MSIITRYKTLIIFIIYNFISVCLNLNIIPDSQNPFIIKFPETLSADNILKLRFSFHANSVGINYSHFFAIQFPQNMGEQELTYDQFDPPVYTCALEDNQGNSYQLTALKPEKGTSKSQMAENYMAFCRLDEVIKKVKVGPEYKYTLTLKFGVKLSVQFIRGVGLFTCTTNNPARVIIDSVPVIGTGGLYPDHTITSLNRALNIELAQLIINEGPLKGKSADFKKDSNAIGVPTDPTVAIFPYTSITINLILRTGATTLIYSADTILALRFPSSVVSPPLSISNEEFKFYEKIQPALTGKVNLVPVESKDMYFVTGWTDNMVDNRIFNIRCLDMKASDYISSSPAAIEVFLFYKNTYSLFSYDKIRMLKITQATVKASVNHPEYWDIWRNAAWPFKFIINTSIDFPYGGYVSIQHTNALEGINRVNFMPSTCDFSDWDPLKNSIDNSFGVRPNCYPLRYDYNYPGTNKVFGYYGSGFFFKVPLLRSGVDYTLNLWGMADNCGGSQFFDSNNPNFRDKSFVQFNFILYIYKNIDIYAFNEDRLKFTNNIIFGKSSEFTMGNKCLNDRITFSNSKPIYYDSTNLLNYLTVNLIGVGNDNMILREITDWSTTIQKNSNTCDDGTDLCYGRDVKNNIFVEKFLYSNSGESIKDSYFMVNFKVAKNVNDFLFNIIPTNFRNLLTDKDPNGMSSGRLVWQFPNKFFTKGESWMGDNPSCYASWTANLEGSTELTQTQLIYSNSEIVNPSSKSNFMSAQAGTIDYIFSNSLFKPEEKSPIRLVSSLYKGSVSTENKFEWLSDFKLKGGTYVIFGLYSTCFKWTLPEIKSLYANIDIQIMWNYATNYDIKTMGVPSKNIRLIKLFPEGGVFNDFSNISNYNLPTYNPIRTHLAYSTDSRLGGVCLIEIDGYLISASHPDDKKNNVLSIWIMFGTLFETDYADPSATYPLAPLKQGLVAFGNQSPGLMTKENMYVDPAIGEGFDQMATIVGNVNSSTTPYGNLKSGYQFLMASNIVVPFVKDRYVTTSSSENLNLLIPYYCPLNAPKNQNGVYLYNSNLLPTVYASWIEMDTYSKMTKNKRILAWNDQINARQFSVFIPNELKSISSWPAASYKYYATLRFSPFTINNENDLYIYNNVIGSSNPSITCSGHILLLKSVYDISQDISVFKMTGLGYRATMGVYPFPSPSRISTSSINTEPVSANQNVVQASGVSPSGSSTLPKGPEVPPAPTQILQTKFTTFYVYSTPFQQAVLAGAGKETITSNNLLPSDLSSTLSSYFFTGVKRPSMDTFIDITNNKFLSVDTIAYFCNSDRSQDLNFLTNYVRHTSNNMSYDIFLLDYGPDLVSPFGSPSMQWDLKDYTIIKNDPGGNFAINADLPGEIPTGGIINLISDNFYPGTVCGLTNGNIAILSECSNKVINKVRILSCASTMKLKSFYICCYNVQMSNLVQLTDLYVTFPMDQSIPGLDAYISSRIYSTKISINPTDPTSSINPFKLDTKMSEAGSELLENEAGLVTKITYEHLEQDGGIGKIIFTITLPRQPLRNMRMTFQGDFSFLVVPGVIPRCLVTFSTEKNKFGSAGWDQGDSLIELCDVSQIGTSKYEGIVITTKSNVYKCGLVFRKILNVSLWPVVMPDFNKAPNLLNNYILLLQSNCLNNLSPKYYLTFRNYYFTMYYPKRITNPIVQYTQYNTLCPLNSALPKIGQVGLPPVQPTPKIPGEYGDYQFDFDIDTSQAAFSKGFFPNEITIFFQYQYYGAIIDGVKCYLASDYSPLLCAFSDEGILNIKFFKSLIEFSNDKKTLSVIVANVRNPFVENQNIVFACSINQADYNLDTRINLIKGSGRIDGGFPLKSIAASSGVFRFLYLGTSPAPISDNNPRASSAYNFRISFDYGNIMTPSSVSIVGTPWIFVYFPDNYHISEYKDLKISAVVEDYTIDENKKIIRTNSYFPSRIIVTGNRVWLTLSVTSINFPANWRYWEIKIRGVPNPNDTTETGSLQDRKRYRIILTNNASNNIYRTLDNMDSQTSEALEKPIDSWLTHVRGLKFEFDYKKWIIDVTYPDTDTSKVNVNTLNILVVNPGRFLKACFYMKKLTKDQVAVLPPAMTVLTLNDSTFSTIDKSYLITTAIQDPKVFYIGVPCITPTGTYIVRFDSSNVNEFSPVVPIQITVDNSNKGLIYYKAPQFVSQAGSAYIYIYLSEPNVDPLIVKWEYDDIHRNDKSSFISRLTVPRGTITDPLLQFSPIRSIYSIFNVLVSNDQYFKINDPNNCYEWKNNKITLKFEGPTSNKYLTKEVKLENSFKYIPYSAIENKNKNTIKFKFTPPVRRVYLFCALLCFDKSYPSDNQIIDAKISSDNDSPLIRFFSQYYNTTNEYEINFFNLARDMKYKMKCIIQSDDGDLNIRKSYGFFVGNQTELINYAYYQYKQYINSAILSNSNSTNTTSLGNSTQVISSTSKTQNISNSSLIDNSTLQSVTIQKILSSIGNYDVNIITAETPIVQCFGIYFHFEPSDEVKYAIINYCQKKYNSRGYTSDGCIICTNDVMNYTNPGLSFATTLTKCSNDEALSSSTYSPIKRQKSSNTPIHYNFSESSKSNHTNLRYLGSNVTIHTMPYFSVCPVMHQLCGSNYISDSYENTFKSMVSDLKDPLSFLTKIGLNSTTDSVTKMAGYRIFSDYKSPDLTLLNIQHLWVNQTGFIEWVNYYPDVPLLCYWKIHSLETKLVSSLPKIGNHTDYSSISPSFKDVITCKDIAWCGVTDATPDGVKVNNDPVKINVDLLRTFEYEHTYFIFYACYNKVPLASKTSRVYMAKNFTSVDFAKFILSSSKGG